MLKDDMRISEYVAYLIISVVTALIICSVFIVIVGGNPLSAFLCMFREAFFTRYGLSEIIVRATPLTLIALGITISHKAGIMNLGGDGQLYLGAIASAMVGITFYGKIPNTLLFVLVLLSSIIVGGVWGGFAGYVKAKYDANEIIVTLMLNFIALYLFRYLIEGPFMDPEVYLAQTAQVPTKLRFTRFILGLRINSSVVIVILLVLMTWIVMKKTVWGYNIGVLGNAPNAAKYAGINKVAYLTVLMFISGAFSGLAGFIEVYAIHYRGLEGLSAEFGFVAVIIALLGNKSPLGVVFASLFVSGLQIGANAMQVEMGIPSSIVFVCQSIIILLLMVIPYVVHRHRLHRAEKHMRKKMTPKDECIE
jgi:ABC-type uncharacterized transport system permease subunit